MTFSPVSPRSEPRVALAVPPSEDLHEPLYLLRFPWDPHAAQEDAKGLIQTEAAEVEVGHETGQDLHGEGVAEVANELANLGEKELKGWNQVSIIKYKWLFKRCQARTANSTEFVRNEKH